MLARVFINLYVSLIVISDIRHLVTFILFYYFVYITLTAIFLNHNAINNKLIGVNIITQCTCKHV